MENLRNIMVRYSEKNNSINLYGGKSDNLAATAGGTSNDINDYPYEWYRENWRPCFEYTDPCPSKDNFEKAFKVAKMLLAEKLLKSRKLSDFIELVEMIAKEL
jgi:hypothetical protein